MPTRLRVAALAAVLALPAMACAAEPVPPDPADAIAALIDRHLLADWVARGDKPGPLPDAGERAPRASPDIIGRAPRAAETRDFLDDPSPTALKRKALVEKLLAMPGHANHFAAATRAAWLPQTLTNFQFVNAG